MKVSAPPLLLLWDGMVGVNIDWPPIRITLWENVISSTVWFALTDEGRPLLPPK